MSLLMLLFPSKLVQYCSGISYEVVSVMLNSAKNVGKVTRLKVNKGSSGFTALLALSSVGLSGLALILHVVSLGSIINIAKKPAPSLVQLVDGQAIEVAAIDSNDRSLKTIQSFTTESLSMLMSWTNELPVANGEPKVVDQGSLVKIKDGSDKRITTATFQSSFLLSDDLRDEALKILADMTPAEVFGGTVKTSLKYQHVTIPVPVDNSQGGKWKINVIATLIKYQQGRGDTVQIPFNKEVIVRAVDTPPLPKGGKFANEIEAVIYSIRRSGLEIVSMKDIEAGDIVKSSSSKSQQSTSEKTSSSSSQVTTLSPGSK
jgi:hypothetical protein